MAVTRVVLATVPPGRDGKPQYIAYLMADGEHLAAATRDGAYWFDAGGTLVRQLAYPRRLGHLSGARLADGGRPVFVGSTDSVGKKLVLVPADGTPPRSLQFEGYGATFADVVGDVAYEVVVSKGSDFLIYDLKGKLLKRVPASDYIWEFLVMNTNDTPRHEILAYLYQNTRDGTFIEVIDAEGERIRGWHEAKANRYTASKWSAPAPSIVAVLDDVVTERDLKGEVSRQHTVPGLGSFKRATTGVLDGDRRAILVANGGCPSRLLVFDASGALVYDEVYEKSATLHVPVPGAREFIVATGPALYRYRLADGAQQGSAPDAASSGTPSADGANSGGGRCVYRSNQPRARSTPRGLGSWRFDDELVNRVRTDEHPTK